MIALCVLVGTLLVAGCTSFSDSGGAGECTDEDARLAEKLNELSVLEVRPPGAFLDGEGAGYGCTDSTYHPYASRWYRPVGAVEEVAAFYLRAVPEAGWKLEYADEIHPGTRVFRNDHLCFSRPVEGGTATLQVGFPGRADEGPDDVLGNEPRDVNLFVMVGSVSESGDVLC